MLVEVEVNGSKLKFLFDTGANQCCIDPLVAKNLCLEDTGQRTIKLVSGLIEVPVFIASSFTLGSWHVNNIQLLGFPRYESVGDSGLLGMNILGQFDVHIYPARKVIRLELLPKK